MRPIAAAQSIEPSAQRRKNADAGVLTYEDKAQKQSSVNLATWQPNSADMSVCGPLKHEHLRDTAANFPSNHRRHRLPGNWALQLHLMCTASIMPAWKLAQH